MTITSSEHATPCRAGTLMWASVFGLIGAAALAPVRPWGWAGSTTLLLALILSLGASGANGGMPRAWQWAGVAAGAILVMAILKAFAILLARGG